MGRLAGSYNVDDILAEVKRKKEAAHSSVADYAPPDSRGDNETVSASKSPFQLKGMTDEFEVPATKAKAMQQAATRTDIPVSRAAAAKKVSDKTQIIPALAENAQQSFQKRRQEKVQQFMQTSLSVIEEETAIADLPQQEDCDENLEGISQFFGGLQRSKGSKKAKGEKKSKKAAKPTAGISDYKKDENSSQELSLKPKKKKSKKNEGIAVSDKKAKKKKEEPDDEGEYITPEDARDVRHDIFGIKRSLSIRLIVTGVCAVILLYLSLCNLYPFPLLNPICPEADMKIYLMVNLMVLVIAALAANAVIGGGLVSLFTLKADHDTPAALCTLAVIAHGVVIIMNSDTVHTGESGFYFFIAAITLFANTVGKRMMIVRIEKNFAIACSNQKKSGEYILENNELAAKLAEGQGFAEPCIAYSSDIGFPEKFLKLSYSDDYSENLSRYISPIFLLFALGLSLVCKLVFDQTMIEAVTVFCAVLCIASPLTPTVIGNLPLLRAAKGLTAQGAFISGYDAVETFEEMNCVAVEAKELYPPQCIEIHGIKALAQSRIDEAILDVASLADKTNGLIAEAFLGMVGNKKDILLPVEEISYEDNGGLVALVGGKEVLLGKRSLMNRHGINMPPEDFEKKFVKGGKKVLFVANSGEVTAMLIVSYKPDQAVSKWVESLGKKELSLIVHTTDANITAKRIASDYHYPEEFIQIVSAQLQDGYQSLRAYRERGKAYIVSPAGASVRLRALAAVHSIKQSIVIGTILQMAGLILGYAMVAFLAFTGAMQSLGFGQMALYQLFWAVAVLLMPNIKKI